MIVQRMAVRAPRHHHQEADAPDHGSGHLKAGVGAGDGGIHGRVDARGGGVRFQETCGWKVRFSDRLEETPPPSEPELTTLRELRAGTERARGGKKEN